MEMGGGSSSERTPPRPGVWTVTEGWLIVLVKEEAVEKTRLNICTGEQPSRSESWGTVIKWGPTRCWWCLVSAGPDGGSPHSVTCPVRWGGTDGVLMRRRALEMSCDGNDGENGMLLYYSPHVNVGLC